MIRLSRVRLSDERRIGFVSAERRTQFVPQPLLMGLGGVPTLMMGLDGGLWILGGVRWRWRKRDSGGGEYHSPIKMPHLNRGVLEPVLPSSSVGDNYDDDPIKPGRGLRQGDPLSPYLFIICAEGLSCLLNREESGNRIHGATVCRGAPSVIHLLFADDCYLFFRASIEETEVIMRVLEEYESMSGQKINFQKTNIMFSVNSPDKLREDICRLLGVDEVADQGKYLGLPSLVGRNKRQILNFIRDRVWHKIKGWSAKTLSRGGKEILLKTVAQAMPNFVMNVFLIPLDLCDELERMMNSYWWGRNREEKKGICWARWDRLCKPKKFGGIGFRKIHEFNIAMLSRQAWRLHTNSDSLMSRVFKAKYFPKSSFLSATLRSNPSFVWRSIFATQEVMRKGIRLRIGNGETADIWRDPWLTDLESGFVKTDERRDLAGSKVWQLFKEGTKEWDLDIIRELFSEEDQMRILSVPVSIRNIEDSWCLSGEKSGEENQRSAFCWNKLWNLNIPLHIRNFLWRLVSGFLPSVEALARKRVFINAQCQVCGSVDETVEHIFFGCEVAVSCWNVSNLKFNLTAVSDVLEWCRSWLEKLKKEESELAAMICWQLWMNRNSAVWENKRRDATTLLNSASQQLLAWKNARRQNLVEGEGKIEEDDGRVVWKPPNAGLFDARSAELIGIREVLSWLKGWRNLIVESDALEVIQDIRNPIQAKGDFLAAHLLARNTRSLSGHRDWFSNFPEYLTPEYLLVDYQVLDGPSFLAINDP
ncbi:uncharacterized protein LOC126668470 [Mercurialis annua]|uniref:uncharacterized protein LOC126668470 n=1 Tax=Mercurialis annua TaxID=3986 RepID=UPI00216012CB|nr:uncharacterized protein LOC126668470 [Mercurialis annua]